MRSMVLCLPTNPPTHPYLPAYLPARTAQRAELTQVLRWMITLDHSGLLLAAYALCTCWWRGGDVNLLCITTPDYISRPFQTIFQTIIPDHNSRTCFQNPFPEPISRTCFQTMFPCMHAGLQYILDAAEVGNEVLFGSGSTKSVSDSSGSDSDSDTETAAKLRDLFKGSAKLLRRILMSQSSRAGETRNTTANPLVSNSTAPVPTAALSPQPASAPDSMVALAFVYTASTSVAMGDWNAYVRKVRPLIEQMARMNGITPLVEMEKPTDIDGQSTNVQFTLRYPAGTNMDAVGSLLRAS